MSASLEQLSEQLESQLRDLEEPPPANYEGGSIAILRGVLWEGYWSQEGVSLQFVRDSDWQAAFRLLRRQVLHQYTAALVDRLSRNRERGWADPDGLIAVCQLFEARGTIDLRPLGGFAVRCVPGDGPLRLQSVDLRHEWDELLAGRVIHGMQSRVPEQPWVTVAHAEPPAPMTFWERLKAAFQQSY